MKSSRYPEFNRDPGQPGLQRENSFKGKVGKVRDEETGREGKRGEGKRIKTRHATQLRPTASSRQGTRILPSHQP